ncbi:LOW QUALITY PROTEIN: transmembrane protein 161B-like [Dioscorea cayenensis subsp. rotundata]|uniref:LOW QUALITY PROTEIN: transmembrane protein 161B-like n=1 Tax=Dioscorea cayennensis subsp. rotundata TaxID=55577 RepID=A0AB40BM17_DIOCR|nr:LOW QUALITY PROTEIN: transmembrane protein 161B-like [Dioscorea cayenensis subsp. rotundata]
MPESDSPIIPNPESGFHPLCHLLLHAALSSSAYLLAALLRLPSLLLHGLHTYIHPDSPSASSLRAAIRRPDAPPEPQPRRPRSKPHLRSDDFDESKAQLLRLRLSDSDLPSRLHFPLFRSAFLFSAAALPNLALPLFPPIPFLAAVLAFSYLLFALVKLSFDRSSSKQSEKQLSLLSGFIGFLFSFFILFFLAPSLLDFDLGQSEIARLAVTTIAGALSVLIFSPALRFSRAFWLGTDQLRWNLSVVSCPAPIRFLLFLAILTNIAAPLLWFNPVTSVFPSEIREFRVWVLAAAAVSQLVVLRSNVQMYLNESVLCWYQRLHSSRVPDMNYARAKIFLHNHYICLVVLQYFAPSTMVLLLLGLSQMKGGTPEEPWRKNFSKEDREELV